MMGKTLAEQGLFEEKRPRHWAVKEVVFPFEKFGNVDPILGPEMRSTGETMGLGRTFFEAFSRSIDAGRETTVRSLQELHPARAD
jgi:carbamoyl-phosphate synthase large subunit